MVPIILSPTVGLIMPKMIGFNINYGLMEASTYRVELYNRFIRIENNILKREFEPFKNKGIIA